jgi:hypothetical protein
VRSGGIIAARSALRQEFRINNAEKLLHHKSRGLTHLSGMNLHFGRGSGRQKSGASARKKCKIQMKSPLQKKRSKSFS